MKRSPNDGQISHEILLPFLSFYVLLFTNSRGRNEIYSKFVLNAAGYGLEELKQAVTGRAGRNWGRYGRVHLSGRVWGI